MYNKLENVRKNEEIKKEEVNSFSGKNRTKLRANEFFNEIVQKVKSREDKSFEVTYDSAKFTGLRWFTNIPKFNEYIVVLFLGFENGGGVFPNKSGGTYYDKDYIPCVAAQIQIFNQNDSELSKCISSHGLRLFEYNVIHDFDLTHTMRATAISLEQQPDYFDETLRLFVDILETVKDLEPSARDK